MLDKRAVGMRGQEEAERFLRKNGYRIIARNWKTRMGEIDLVGKRKNDLAFVEVKALVSPRSPFKPEDHFTFSKQKRLARLALLFLARYNLCPASYQIDLVAVDLNDDLTLREIRYYPRAGGG